MSTRTKPLTAQELSARGRSPTRRTTRVQSSSRSRSPTRASAADIPPSRRATRHLSPTRESSRSAVTSRRTTRHLSDTGEIYEVEPEEEREEMEEEREEELEEAHSRSPVASRRPTRHLSEVEPDSEELEEERKELEEEDARTTGRASISSRHPTRHLSESNGVDLLMEAKLLVDAMSEDDKVLLLQYIEREVDEEFGYYDAPNFVVTPNGDIVQLYKLDHKGKSTGSYTKSIDSLMHSGKISHKWIESAPLYKDESSASKAARLTKQWH